MKKEDFESLQRGMAEADAFLEGKREGFVVHAPVNHLAGCRSNARAHAEQ